MGDVLKFFTSGLATRRVYLVLLSTLVCLSVSALAFAKTLVIVIGNVEVAEELASFVASKSRYLLQYRQQHSRLRLFLLAG